MAKNNASVAKSLKKAGFYETGKNPQAVINFFSKTKAEPIINTARNQALAVYSDLLEKFSSLTDVPDIESD
jgi:hypothetical protein